MATFDGRLWFLGESEDAVKATMDVGPNEVSVTVAGSVIGDWTIAEISVEEKPDGLHIFAEDEEMVFLTSTPGLVTALTGQSTVATALKAMSQSDEPPNPPDSAVVAAPAGDQGTAVVQWWQARKASQKAIILGVSAVLLVVLFNLGGDSPTETFASEPSADSGATPADVSDSAATPVNISDWNTEAAYRDDVSDTADKMGALLGTVGEIATDVADGAMTLSQFSELMEIAVESATSHRNHFRGKTAPAGYEASHRHLVNALNLWVDAFEAAGRGADNVDFEMIGLAVDLMEEGTSEINKATDALP